jgi:hypothetical protein
MDGERGWKMEVRYWRAEHQTTNFKPITTQPINQ